MRLPGVCGYSLAAFCVLGCAGSKDGSPQANGAQIPGIGTLGPTGAAGTSAAGLPGAATGTFGNTGATNPVMTAPPPLPPEMKVNIDFEQPQASDRFVYAANPKAGTVSIIDAQTQAIQTVETGDRPTFLRTLAGSDDAIVLNVGSDTATLLRSPATGVQTSSVGVVRGANAIATAPDGKHALVYFNAAYSTAGNPSGSFQDVTVLSLKGNDLSAVGMTVGFKPRAVFFARDGSAAYAVTDDGISVLDFARLEREGTGIAKLISLGPNVDQKGLDVSVTASGEFALTREPSKTVIRLIDLQSGEIKSLDLASVVPDESSGNEGANENVDAGTDGADGGVTASDPVAVPVALPPDVSDLEVAPNGAFALAVVRNRSLALKLPIPEAFADSGANAITTFEVAGELIGTATIAAGSDRALLYTTAAEVERITILALDGSATPRTVALRKTVKAVAIAPDGLTALIIHKKALGDPNQAGIDPDTQLARSFGYSVLRMPEGDVKLQVTATDPTSFTIVPDGAYLFLLFRDDPTSVREVQKIEAKSFLVQPLKLGSPPISLGAVPKSKRLFVNQEHPDGRITFIDWESNAQRTVTGFALNSRIRD